VAELRMRCIDCGEQKPLSQFRLRPKGRGLGRDRWCDPCCVARGRRYESFRNRHQGQLLVRAATLRFHRLKLDDYERILAEQGWGCAICGSTNPGSGRTSFLVDHDHQCCRHRLTVSRPACGRCIRGLLCNPCNRALGVFELRDSLDEMASYVQQNRTRLEEYWAAELGEIDP
jgi:hypothetical protein